MTDQEKVQAAFPNAKIVAKYEIWDGDNILNVCRDSFSEDSAWGQAAEYLRYFNEVKDKVKAVYPDAHCIKDGDKYYVFLTASKKKAHAESYGEFRAWENALDVVMERQRKKETLLS